MRTLAMAIVAVLAAGAPAGAQGMLADVPLEVLAYKSDLIVVGEVLQVGDPSELELTLPDQPRAVKGWYCVCRFKVARTIKDRRQAAAPKAPSSAAPPPTAAPATATAPASQPARSISILAACAAPATGPAELVAARALPNLQAGASYVLLLREFTNDNRERGLYYLPSYPKNYQPLAQANVVAKAADVEGWPWGKPAEGLQVALLSLKAAVPLPPGTQSGAGGEPKAEARNAYLPVLVALRNSGDKPLCVNLHEPDACLSIVANRQDGKMLTAALYEAAATAPAAYKAANSAGLDPGAVLFVGPAGRAEYGLGLNLPLTPGTWRLYAIYESKRQALGLGGQPLWQGRIESTPTPVEATVEPPRPATPRTAGLPPG